jgi:hypothetical protein
MTGNSPARKSAALGRTISLKQKRSFFFCVRHRARLAGAEAVEDVRLRETEIGIHRLLEHPRKKPEDAGESRQQAGGESDDSSHAPPRGVWSVWRKKRWISDPGALVARERRLSSQLKTALVDGALRRAMTGRWPQAQASEWRCRAPRWHGAAERAIHQASLVFQRAGRACAACANGPCTRW